MLVHETSDVSDVLVHAKDPPRKAVYAFTHREDNKGVSVPPITKYDPLTVDLAAIDRDASSAPTSVVRLYVNEAATPYFVGVWEAEPGLHREYVGPETVYILQGRATITGGSGQAVDVSAGDFVVIDAGETMDWQVHETVRKIAIKGA